MDCVCDVFWENKCSSKRARKKKKQSIENEKYMEGGKNRFERRGVVT